MTQFPNVNDKEEEELINTILEIIKNSRTIDEKYSEGIKEKTAREQAITDILTKIN